MSAGTHRHLHSFPTRRSSDLTETPPPREQPAPVAEPDVEVIEREIHPAGLPKSSDEISHEELGPIVGDAPHGQASEIGRAHVELQSLAYLVCRLLLEKKKRRY